MAKDLKQAYNNLRLQEPIATKCFQEAIASFPDITKLQDAFTTVVDDTIKIGNKAFTCFCEKTNMPKTEQKQIQTLIDEANSYSRNIVKMYSMTKDQINNASSEKIKKSSRK